MGWTIFIGVILSLAAIYAIVWIVLLIMLFMEQSRILATFDEAFSGSTFETSVTRLDMQDVLQISWPDGNSLQHVSVDADGKMLTPVQWESGRGNLSKLKISKRMRSQLEPKTMEIAAMYKLQHGPLSHSNSEDMGATQAPF